jgi:hypothetical protein
LKKNHLFLLKIIVSMATELLRFLIIFCWNFPFIQAQEPISPPMEMETGEEEEPEFYRIVEQMPCFSDCEYLVKDKK